MLMRSRMWKVSRLLLLLVVSPVWRRSSFLARMCRKRWSRVPPVTVPDLLHIGESGGMFCHAVLLDTNIEDPRVVADPSLA